MRKLVMLMCLGVGLMGGACSKGSGGVVTAPSVAAVKPTQLVYTGVSWGSTIGQVTVTAQGTGTYTFIVWDANNYNDQRMMAATEPTLIQDGASAFLSLAFAESCGTRYQADVYKDLPRAGTYTLSDVGNYLYAARGSFYQAADCDRPTPPVVVVPPPQDEPPPTCQDREANNFGGLLPCTFGEGVIIVEDPPPSVEEPPAKFLFCHVDVNVTGGKKPKTIVHEQQVGGQNGIPLTAILNGHTANGPAPFAEHALDYYGVCDARWANLGQQ